MPYGKEDFLGWDDDDTNLDLLLGEYTCIEVELSDDETVHSTTDQPSATCSKTYKCSECPKTYSSISGLRGHLNKKTWHFERFRVWASSGENEHFAYSKTKTDQLRGDREADQRLCFRYIDNTIPLLSKSETSSL